MARPIENLSVASSKALPPRIMKEPDMKSRLLNEGADPVVNTPEQFVDYMRVDSANWAKVIKGAGIKAQ